MQQQALRNRLWLVAIAGILPLAMLGMLLALVYEATGSIRVAIIAHGLFNLNTIILLLSGLTQSNS